MHEDLEKLGLRPRRTHDSRRTFISLALADGARKDILRWITHGPTGDVMDLYSTLPWKALCEEVTKINIPLGNLGYCYSPCDLESSEPKKSLYFNGLQETNILEAAGIE